MAKKPQAMTFEEFWTQNKARLLELAQFDVKFALHEACEEAWDEEKMNHIRLLTVDLPRFKPNAIIGREDEDDGTSNS